MRPALPRCTVRLCGLLLAHGIALSLLGGCSDAGRDDASIDAATEIRTRIDLSGEGWRLWLDEEASWEDDELFAPPVEVSTLDVRSPTIGWDAMGEQGLAVSVPGTVEEHTWPERGDYIGVSWWWREFELPELGGADGTRPRIVRLAFEAVRQRAEVFVNGVLIGYDAVGNTPFELDVTGVVHAGSNQLAVRVTDPGGNFSWEDFDALAWGEQTIPASHGFGGITGGVSVSVLDPLHLADVFVKNTPLIVDPDDPEAAPELEIDISLRNDDAAPAACDILAEIADADDPSRVVFSGRLGQVSVPPGESVFSQRVTLENARWWSLDDPHLYRCRITLYSRHGRGGAYAATDSDSVRFGVRTFEIDGLGEDAVLRLNGERIVLRSAISWGFWPTSGMVPTPELARRQVESAQALGLNMLNHHRTIAAPGLLDVHDELGLLAYAEPGGYTAHGGDELCFALAREKLLRMVRRDRNHPSLVLYNMINEETAEPEERHRRDIRDAHAADPTRTITYTSGWSEDGEHSLKLHMRAWDDDLHAEGWWDYHNAPGPGVQQDEAWNGPDDHLRRSENRGEIVFWGEEGAIASPPRLAPIAEALDAGHPGWDGEHFAAQHDAWSSWLDARPGFAALDELTRSLGDVALEYQARTIENVRLGDVADGYVVNGWDDERFENHSGIVDAWRHPKGNADVLARANAPLALAVKLRRSAGHAGELVGGSVQTAISIPFDIALVNEVDLSGSHRLDLRLEDAQGRAVWTSTHEVIVTGGEVFGQMLLEDQTARVEASAGMHTLRAELWNPRALTTTPTAEGSAEFLVVDWKSRALPGNGAVLEGSHSLRKFAAAHEGLDLPVYFDGLPPLDWVLVGDFDVEPRELIAPEAFRAPDGTPGLLAEYFADEELTEPAEQRNETHVDFQWSRQPPVESFGRFHYSARFTSTLVAPEGGSYRLHAMSDDGVRVWLDGELLIDDWEEHDARFDRSAAVEMAAGSEHDLRIEYRQRRGNALLRLYWTKPSRTTRTEALVTDLLRRVEEDGTRLAILGRADTWAQLFAEAGAIDYDGRLWHGRYWMGGGFFSREHPLLAGLPTGGALGRPYQELVAYERDRFGLRLSGEEAVVGCFSDHQLDPATAVGIVTHGKGRLLFSTLDVMPALNKQSGSAEVVRKYVCNVVEWAGSR